MFFKPNRQCLRTTFQYGVDEIGTHRITGFYLKEQLIISRLLITHIDQCDGFYSSTALSHIAGDAFAIPYQMSG